jgi:polysaccharide biosynthesis protein PelF
VGARQHGTHVMLSEHSLYTRDIINSLLNGRMDYVVRAEDWRTAHGISVQQRAWMAWYTEIGRLAYHTAERITYLYPEAIAEAVGLGLGTELQKAFVIPNGIPTAAFDQAHRRFQQLSAERGEQRQPWRLAYAARLVPIKGLPLLLEALALLKDNSNVDFALDVMGHANETPDYAEQCRQRCTELGLDDVVNFTGYQNLRRTLAHYDLLVLPSYNEGMPIVVLEAMAVGLPVVGTRVGGMAEVIESPLTGRGDDRCGVLVEPGDSMALARALHHVLSDPRLYQYLQSNARNRVVSRFRLEQAMSAYRNIYHQIAAKTNEFSFPPANGQEQPPSLQRQSIGLISETAE